MSDSCKHCTVRGDIALCRITPCHTHDSWYAQQQQDEIERLNTENKARLKNSQRLVRASKEND